MRSARYFSNFCCIPVAANSCFLISVVVLCVNSHGKCLGQATEKTTTVNSLLTDATVKRTPL